jgi:hypothetical protein
MLTVGELLLGGTVTRTVRIPADVLRPADPPMPENGASQPNGAVRTSGTPSAADAATDVGPSPATAATSAATTAVGEEDTVVLRPLRLADVQRIQQAAAESPVLTGVLMVQQALVAPELTIDEVSRMHAGLVEFLLREINRISGLAMSGDELTELVRAPLARACFVVAREFGWTPEDCAELTLGQLLLYLELLTRDGAAEPG